MRTRKCKKDETLFMGDAVKLNLTMDGIREGTAGKVVELSSIYQKRARNGRTTHNNFYKVRFNSNGVSRTIKVQAKYLSLLGE